jgi:hypothetical protein
VKKMDESRISKSGQRSRSGGADRSRSRSSSRRKQSSLTAERLIKLLRKHGTLTLVVCVLAVSAITGYIAIALGA